MKTLLSLANGALVITEQAGVFTLSFNEAVAVGGGEAAGLVKVQGSGSVVLSGKQAFDLGLKLLEAHSPVAIQPVEAGIGAIVDGVVASS